MKIPILRLGRILLVSIQDDLTDNDAMQFQSDLVERVAEIEALGVAIDITALDVVDSYMARVINDTACMVGLLGAEVVICGVQPFVAMTLIEMGRDLLGANCAFNLEQGLEILNRRIATRGDIHIDEDEDD
ncbi:MULTISPECIES: STAS domain-containing protein [Marichromatium]|uniref:Anti-anti-sigma factor n=2 Tax=Marichromatium TaxID=85076 RepID=A0A4R4AJQ8_MARGR|nr:MULTISPECIES: STAS domain-containing protein [Marichromatium]MBO8085491.1 STAS domain-containing protein [Marichromatium sp.]KXX64275.1 anti-anti-sigma factor [Marichromatium gracile]MBK1710547.1 STAS domain-containing protein [Marichromatium gracile]NKN34327.1 STAS domain-containing protein [Marichromatium bheemlicum]RNE92659.1 STAS domain-containing protein [Marichromatium sp. AB32]